MLIQRVPVSTSILEYQRQGEYYARRGERFAVRVRNVFRVVVFRVALYQLVLAAAGAAFGAGGGGRDVA
jgi:hypothetical protein